MRRGGALLLLLSSFIAALSSNDVSVECGTDDQVCNGKLGAVTALQSVVHVRELDQALVLGHGIGSCFAQAG
jgi:hypothetical protein